jgi:nitronate monooxygenase
MKPIEKIKISGTYVWPIIEGGKGIGASNGETAGAFAAANSVGTISGVFPPSIDEYGKMYPLEFSASTRKGRSKEIIKHSIEGSIREIKKAHEISEGRGRIHLNVLWGIAGAEEIIDSVLSKTKGMLHGITCGAGMPYKLASIAKKYGVYYYPIVSSARAFSALWARAYKEVPELLGGIVYEDPWNAGGHNGLSSKDNPHEPENPYYRVEQIRTAMLKQGLDDVPIVMAGGVWDLKKFENWIDNPAIGPIAFQIGTRSLLTQESPISEQWKQKLMKVKKEDVILNNFSSTGFNSSAIKNEFIKELEERSSRQISISKEPKDEHIIPFIKSGTTKVFITESGRQQAREWIVDGYTNYLETPDSTLLFVNKEKAKAIKTDQRDCKGCLAACKFSSWSDDKEKSNTTGILPDPRSFCIFKTLQNLICGEDAEHELMFSGHSTYKFSMDPLYKNGNIPSVKELIAKMLQGN